MKFKEKFFKTVVNLDLCCFLTRFWEGAVIENMKNIDDLHENDKNFGILKVTRRFLEEKRNKVISVFSEVLNSQKIAVSQIRAEKQPQGFSELVKLSR